MKLKTYLRRAASWGLCLLICVSGLTPTTFAEKAVQPIGKIPDKCSLTLEFPYSGLPVSLYRVASVDRNVEFSAVGSFRTVLRDLRQDLNVPKTAGDWKDLADTLTPELAANNITPYRTGTVQAVNGRNTVRFSDLPPGLYLIRPQATYTVKDTAAGEETTYTVSSYMVCLPNWMQQTKNGPYTWVADVYADFSGKVTTEVSTSRNVIKVWQDANGRPLNNHPASVQVQLWRDGQLVDTVTLNRFNGWSYTWTDLDPEHSWSIREVGSGNYTVRISSNDGVNYKITNILPPDDPKDPSNPKDPDKPKDPDNPPVDPNDPDNPPEEPTVDIDEPDVPLGPPPSLEDPKGPADSYEEIELDDMEVPLGNLPQTGQLWWPVPLLAVAGIFLFLIGWVKHRGAQDEE